MDYSNRNKHLIISRVGEKFTTNEGYEIEIVEYFNNRNSTIKFNDGSIKTNIEYNNIKRGSVSYPEKSRVGEKHITNEGYELEIIEYYGCHNVKVLIDNRITLENINYQAIKEGEVANPMHKSIFNIGYTGINIIKPALKKDYSKIKAVWRAILKRCYSEESQEKYPSYKGVIVCEEWHNFQNFYRWYIENHKDYMNKWHIDKDILIKGNKIYSPETCCFVPHEVNGLFITNKSTRNKYPIGVNFRKGRGFCVILDKGGNRYSAQFDTVEEAFQAYKVAKEKHIKEVADKWKDFIDPRVYQAMYNYEVEITD